MNPNKYYVIIPAYQEELRIAAVVQKTLAHCPNVLVVDDGSTDKTAAVAEAAGAVVIRHKENQGKGAAVATGNAEALKRGAEVVITIDADGQHDPAEIPGFISVYEQTLAPVIVGNRMADTRTMPLVRRWTNRFMSWLLSRYLGQHVPDTQCGYRLYRCDFLAAATVTDRHFAAESEILLRLAEQGVRIGSVGIKTIYGDTASKIRPVRDTLRFFAMLRRYQKGRL